MNYRVSCSKLSNLESVSKLNTIPIPDIVRNLGRESSGLGEQQAKAHINIRAHYIQLTVRTYCRLAT